MREIRTSGSMSGDGKRNDAYDTKIETAPVLDSTGSNYFCVQVLPVIEREPD